MKIRKVTTVDYTVSAEDYPGMTIDEIAKQFHQHRLENSYKDLVTEMKLVSIEFVGLVQ